MKNKLLLTLIRLFKKKPTTDNRILVVATTALGDTLWATPALESLRKSFPDAYIAVLTSPIGEQVLRHNPAIDHIHLLKGCPFRLRKELGQFKDVLVFHASQRIVLPLCATLGASRIVGTAGINKGLDALLTDPLDNRNQHEIVRRLEIIERIGAKRTTETLSFFLQPEEKTAPLQNTIVLHPGSKDGFKRWPAAHFITVGKALQKEGYQILISGTAEELPLIKQIAEQIQNARISDPKLSLRSFAALLSQVEMLISNDTGPVHLACALDVPVIALYSPTDPALCGPHKAPKAIVLSKPPTCRPCYKRKCRIPFCLEQISPEEVLRKVLDKNFVHQ